MVIGAMNLDLKIYHSQSLKEKRTILASLKDKLRQRFNISIIESDYQDLWQKCRFSVVMVANLKKTLDQTFDRVEEFILNHAPVEIINQEKEYL